MSGTRRALPGHVAKPFFRFFCLRRPPADSRGLRKDFAQLHDGRSRVGHCMTTVVCSFFVSPTFQMPTPQPTPTPKPTPKATPQPTPQPTPKAPPSPTLHPTPKPPVNSVPTPNAPSSTGPQSPSTQPSASGAVQPSNPSPSSSSSSPAATAQQQHSSPSPSATGSILLPVMLGLMALLLCAIVIASALLWRKKTRARIASSVRAALLRRHVAQIPPATTPTAAAERQ